MEKLLEFLNQGYAIKITPYPDPHSMTVDVTVRKENLYARRTIPIIEIECANFDVILFSVHECVERIKDMSKGA